MIKITIRKMRRSDFAFAIRLTDTMNWDLTERDFAFMMELEPEGCFVALADSKRVGITTTTHFGRIGCIGNVIVDEQCRSQGIGVKLVKEAIRYLSEKSATTIALYAYQNTVEFYERLGFQVDHHLIRFTGQGQRNQENCANVRGMTQPDLEEAISLLKTVLRKLVSVDVGIGVSEKRRRIADVLVGMNFKEEFRVTLMHLGESLPTTRCMVAMESLERS